MKFAMCRTTQELSFVQCGRDEEGRENTRNRVA